MLSGQVKRQKKGRNPAFIRFFEENPAENRSGGSQPENMESKISRLSERNQIAIYIGLGTFYTTPPHSQNISYEKFGLFRYHITGAAYFRPHFCVAFVVNIAAASYRDI